MAKIDTEGLTVKQLRAIKGWTQTKVMEMTGDKHALSWFAENIDNKTFDELRAPHLTAMQDIYKLETILTGGNKSGS